MPDPSSDLPLAPLARYAKFSDAQERGLVAAALDRAYWVEREGDEYVLYVEERAREEIARELERFEVERSERTSALAQAAARPIPRIETQSLYVAAWIMSVLWGTQNLLPRSLTDQGVAESGRIVFHGEWWRAATALTLHGDLAHFAANLAAGLLFAAFALPQLGTGMTWLAIVLTGIAGNLGNAWFYRSEPHFSIGASTAVFGALGLLVAGEFVERWRHPASRAWWQLVVPVGAGLALLAFLGAGEEARPLTDYMAHLFGFCAGCALGAIAALTRVRERTPRWVQRVTAFAGPLLLAIAWAFALQWRG